MGPKIEPCGTPRLILTLQNPSEHQRSHFTSAVKITRTLQPSTLGPLRKKRQALGWLQFYNCNFICVNISSYLWFFFSYDFKLISRVWNFFYTRIFFFLHTSLFVFSLQVLTSHSAKFCFVLLVAAIFILPIVCGALTQLILILFKRAGMKPKQWVGDISPLRSLVAANPHLVVWSFSLWWRMSEGSVFKMFWCCTII